MKRDSLLAGFGGLVGFAFALAAFSSTGPAHAMGPERLGDVEPSPSQRIVHAPDAVPVSTTISYQGQLKSSGANVNGSCDMAFRLYDDPAAGALVGSPITQTRSVTNGLFTTQLNFGSSAFGDNARWLDVRVRCPAGAGGYTALAPRQPMNAAPYALYALGGAFWSLTGNSGTNPSTHWLGTADAQPIVIGTGGFERMRIGTGFGTVAVGTSGPCASVRMHVFVASAGFLCNASAIRGESASSTGVAGLSTSSAGVQGDSSSNYGVAGYSASSAGVYGESSNNYGVLGISDNNTGVYGRSNKTGVWGYSYGSEAVAAAGVYGQSDNGKGVFGVSTTDYGVIGSSSISIGVYGLSSFVGVKGYNAGTGVGVAGESTSGTGVYASSTSGGYLFVGYDTAAANNRFLVERSTGNVYADGSYNCGLGSACFNTGIGADVAERIDAAETLQPGDLVEIDPNKPDHYRLARKAYSKLVAGIVSTSPGVTLNNNDLADNDTGRRTDNRPLLALVGTAPLKVSAENGPIRIGDLMVASSTPGHAMRAGARPDVGSIVGKALEPLNRGKGVIKVLITLR